MRSKRSKLDGPAKSSLSREKAWAEMLAAAKQAGDSSKPVQLDLFDLRHGASSKQNIGALAWVNTTQK
ncbi:MAG: hypothetical protein ACOYMG_14790 [Candidatus Methylumidiphilus sp.]